MFDRQLHELAVSTRWAILHGRDGDGTLLESWRAGFERALGGEIIRADEERWVQADGTTRWLRWAMLPWWNQFGEIGGVAIWSEDITDRKRADEMRRETEQSYTTIFEKSPFAIALVRWSDRTVVSANAAFLSLFELTRADALGKSSADLGFADLGAEDALERELEARGSVRDFEYVRRLRSGVTRTLSLNLDWVVLGGERHALATIRDVTELKRAHETARLYEQAKHLDMLKTRFFASVSHELRTPLTLIMATTDRMLQTTPVGEERRHHAVVLARNARTLLEHVNDLLDVSKLEAGRMKLEYVDADVREVVRHIASHFDALAADRQITYTVEVADGLRAQVDPDKLGRVVFNVLANAFKFTPQGGRIRVALRALDGRIGVVVADSGPGIPPSLRELVFEPFRQVEGGPTRRFGGTGLGLAIAREVIAMHRGTIRVGDAPEGGALFEIELPRYAPDGTYVRRGSYRIEGAAQLPAPCGPAAPPGYRIGERGPLVLVIEDDPELNRFVAETLAVDHRVETAHDGQEGLRKAIALKPDLMLTDIMLPTLSGDELVRVIRTSHRELDSMPIVALTAKADDPMRLQVLREGAQDYLSKPFSIDELRLRVDNLLALGTKRAWLQAVIDQMPEAVVLVEASGRIATQNHAARALSSNARIDLRHPTGEPLASDELPIQQAIRDEQATYGLELVAHRGDGRLVPVLVSATPVRMSDGRLAGATMVLQDISALKELDRQREEWASLIAHDLQQPINAISLLAEMLLRAPLEPKDGERVLRMRSLAFRLSGMVSELSDASQLEAHRLVIARDRVEMNALVREVIERVPGTAARVAALPDGAAAVVIGDAGRLEQVVTNLLSNADKYSTPGTLIDVGLAIEGGEAHVWVSNTGPGLSSEELPLLFKRFVRTRRARESGAKGSGLGLYIAKGLIEAHGGRMWVESIPDRMTTFHFTIPLAQPSA